MPNILVADITHRKHLILSLRAEGEVVIGRQLTPNEPLGQVYDHAESGSRRAAIASYSEVRVSRTQLALRPTDNGIAVVNRSPTTVLIDDATELPAGEEISLAGACRISFGPLRAYSAHVWPERNEPLDVYSLPHQAPVPGHSSVELAATFSPESLPKEHAHAVRHWLKSITEVLQSAAGSDEFLQRAARGVVKLMNFDTARVLLLENGQWSCQAQQERSGGDEGECRVPSRRILERAKAERRTIWSDGNEELSGDFSQVGVHAVVCAPICNRSGEVVGALYADRHSTSSSPGALITEPEALFVETLAYGIAVGLERTAQEKSALEQRVRFEQFFSRELAEQLTLNPGLLTSKDALVTILFADIRGFSGISERVGAEVKLQWIQDILDDLTEVVMRHGGVVVDYIGDAIMAMWGAPVPQSDQARLACQAALEMQIALGPLNERWRDRLGGDIEIAAGIHTGITQVGNIGSRRKFKYGPLGHAVNLASRVQGANKHLKSSLLITRSTHDALGSGFLTRRLCAIQVVNIEQPVDVFELRLTDDEDGRVLCQLYEKALEEFEAQDFRRAARTLGDYLRNYQDDGPSHILLWRTVNCLVNPPVTFDRTWTLPGK